VFEKKEKHSVFLKRNLPVAKKRQADNDKWDVQSRQATLLSLMGDCPAVLSNMLGHAMRELESGDCTG